MHHSVPLEALVRSHLRFLQVSEDLIVRRSHLVAEVLRTSGFKVRFHRDLFDDDLLVPAVEYVIPDEMYSVHKAKPNHWEVLNCMEGTGLNRGDLLFLSIVAEYAQELVPNWTHRFKDDLRNPCGHLDVLNEIWWLAHFKSPSNLQANYSLNPPTDVDWRFQSGSLTVNLEVKRRRKDLLRPIHGKEKPDIFEDITKKFVKDSGALNVAAISLYGPIDRDVQEMTAVWLKSPDNGGLVDAVLLWTPTGHKPTIEVQALKGAAELKQLLNPLTDEEQSLALGFHHPVAGYYEPLLASKPVEGQFRAIKGVSAGPHQPSLLQRDPSQGPALHQS